MKYIYIIFSFFLSTVFYAQSKSYNLHVSYKMETYFSGLNVYDANLYCNSSESIFSYKSTTRSEGIKQNDSGNYAFKVEDTTLYYLQTDKAADTMVELPNGLKKEKVYVICENFPDIDWSITADTMSIGKYLCYKATCEFRGRNYTVWFTPDIVSHFGPWKLHGLPGLVLSAYDSKKEVFFTAETIKTVDVPIGSYMPTGDNVEKVSRQEYKKMMEKKMEDFGEKLSSKLDRGFTVKVSTSIKSIEID